MAKSFLMDLYKKAVKNMSGKRTVNMDLLHNKIVLYVIFAISLINLLIWVVGGDVVNVIVFLLVGFLTTFFSKNMIVVLLFALVVSNIVKFGIQIGQEGFDNKDEEQDHDGFQEGGEPEGMDEDHEDGFQEGDDVEGMEDTPASLMDKLDKSDEKNTVEKDHVKVTGKSTEKETDKDTNKATAKVTEKATEKDTEKATEKDADKDTEKAAEKAAAKKETEGMQTLAYSFIEPAGSHSSVLEQQTKLLSNISTLSPYLINVENESVLRSQMKYSEFTKK